MYLRYFLTFFLTIVLVFTSCTEPIDDKSSWVILRMTHQGQMVNPHSTYESPEILFLLPGYEDKEKLQFDRELGMIKVPGFEENKLTLSYSLLKDSLYITETEETPVESITAQIFIGKYSINHQEEIVFLKSNKTEIKIVSQDVLMDKSINRSFSSGNTDLGRIDYIETKEAN